MKKIPLVDLKKQYQEINKDLDLAVKKVLSNANFILGEEVSKFENEFAKYIGVKYCVGVASGWDAIFLILKALGVKKGDEVIVPANTFIATVLPVVALGAKPILVDVDPKTNLIDLNLLKKAISTKTKVIIPVHLYGYPCHMDEIVKIAKKKKIFVLEDACQAHGSTYNGKKCGSFGIASAFSFYPGKNLGAAGDAGAVVTNSLKIATLIRTMRDVGQNKKYHHAMFGLNSRLDTLQAAILSVKLKKLDEWNERRIKIAKLYTKLLSGLPLSTPTDLGESYKSNYHLYVIKTKKRDQLHKYLDKNGVHCGIHYPIPLHKQKALANLGYKKTDFPNTSKAANEILSLPMYPQLKTSEVTYVSKLIHDFYKEQK
jgi:dTDP-4-amino-4,6-dideoxygalactose transaminase